MKVFLKDVSILDYYNTYCRVDNKKEKKKSTDFLDKVFSEIDCKLIFKVENKSLLQHFFIENDLSFSILEDSKTKIELINVVKVKKFFLNFKEYRNYADIIIDGDGYVDFIVYDQQYLDFSKKLSLKLLEYVNVRLTYSGPVEYDLNTRSSRRQREFFINEK